MLDKQRVMFPVLGVDLGLKKIGLAWSSNDLAIDVLPTIKVEKMAAGFKQIEEVIRDLSIKTVVIGRPESGRVVYWVKKLKAFLNENRPDVSVLVVPETLSSQKAWQKMTRLGYSFKEKKTGNHGFAAIEILKEVLKAF
ncbi:MAG: pre-16S rRNA-processing nuclease YqgF [bacterium]|nr:pre-16S rRNA-processing nuclease YqgF [bacterium]